VRKPESSHSNSSRKPRSNAGGYRGIIPPRVHSGLLGGLLGVSGYVGESPSNPILGRSPFFRHLSHTTNVLEGLSMTKVDQQIQRIKVLRQENQQLRRREEELMNELNSSDRMKEDREKLVIKLMSQGIIRNEDEADKVLFIFNCLDETQVMKFDGSATGQAHGANILYKLLYDFTQRPIVARDRGETWHGDETDLEIQKVLRDRRQECSELMEGDPAIGSLYEAAWAIRDREK
jgi:hypothetical protein